MEFKKFNNRYVIRLDKGDEIIESLKKICNMENIKTASITGIGATNNATIGVYELNLKKYHEKNVKGDFEISSLVGNISTFHGEVLPHIHVNLTGLDHNCIGGHLLSANISITCEIFMDILDGEIRKEFNDAVGANTFKF
ncbi:PPC domain-containing DNA-binding protein [Clostridium rectalis]|uniref:PPC domain-containing DNA-binding protein n=1 Tax=Clostridium rectalis TaxID=2040295 RepID=UPI000F636FE2|nr:PPC domain-containing DNA-binding protein [Clostridium rectalis]